jgi:hypothetical protein
MNTNLHQNDTIISQKQTRHDSSSVRFSVMLNKSMRSNLDYIHKKEGASKQYILRKALKKPLEEWAFKLYKEERDLADEIDKYKLNDTI